MSETELQYEIERRFIRETINMSQTLHRQWIMLDSIPTEPNTITVKSIKALLDQKGYNISIRSIERDLASISDNGVFPIFKSEESRPYGWSWPSSVKPFGILSMDSLVAVSFVLIEQRIRDILPSSSAERLDPYFSIARSVLNDRTGKNKLSYLPSKIRLLERGLKRNTPKVADGVIDAVHQALLDGKKIEVEYLSSARDEHDRFEINPLGLVFKGGVPYLLCTFWEGSDLKQLALHRISQAYLLSGKSKIPDGFSLDEYIASGKFSYLLGDKPIRFKAKISDFLARHLSEEPLAEDQKIVYGKGGPHTFSATIEDSHELRWWILSFGSSIEVEKPESLRKEISKTANDMCKLYKG